MIEKSTKKVPDPITKVLQKLYHVDRISEYMYKGYAMDVLKAKQIILNNSQISENTFIYNLHEKCCFSEELFWEYYDSIVTLVRNRDTKSSEEENQITDVHL